MVEANVKRTSRAAALLGALTATAVALGPAVATPAQAAASPGGSPTAQAAASPSGTPTAQAAPRPGGATRVAPVDWQPCREVPAVDCGTVTVPVDWSRPDGETVGIAVARRKASDPAARIGTLLADPGGPGSPGAAWVRSGPIFSAAVHRRFDVVGFDPRGVGGSHPVRCDFEIAARVVPPVPRNQAEFEQIATRNKDLGESCRKLTGRLFDFVDTASVARDMDAIRAAMGEAKISYYGLSYGTLMGQQYAELFPDRVRAMVIDSNMDHSTQGTWWFLRSEAAAAQEGFRQFAAWCDRTAGCALHGQDVRRAFADLYARAGRGELTLPGSSIKIDQFRLIGAANAHFYGPDWQALADLLAHLRGGPADHVLAQRAAQLLTAGRAAHGEPIEDPFSAVFCQDWRLPVLHFAELEAYRRGLGYVAPDMKLSPLGWSAVTSCIGWPGQVRNPQHRLRVRGAPPILMLNSRYDPVTPRQWAGNVARQMGAVLLTYDGWGHGTYFKGSTCVTGAADSYLITGTPPARGTHCPAVEPPSLPRYGAEGPAQPRPPLPPRWPPWY
jgi:pimeloyl-ACP methyl ester carboxylesterase